MKRYIDPQEVDQISLALDRLNRRLMRVMGMDESPPADPTPKLIAALDAAESILRYAPAISTNVKGTRPSMGTNKALKMVREALELVGAGVPHD